MWRHLCVVLVVLATSQVQGQVNLIYQPYAKGSEVVETVIDIIRENCILAEDYLFLRRIAYVESMDGTQQFTFRSGYYGGIWQVNEDMFRQTQGSSVILHPMYDSIRNSSLHINWQTVDWQDLLQPIYSGLAAALLITLNSGGHGVPRSVNAQKVLWQATWQSGKDFTGLSDIMELGCHGNDIIDLVFVLDSSSSVQESHFTQVKTFITQIIDAFNVEPSATRVALVKYSTDVKVEFHLGDYSTKADVKNAVMNIKYEPGATNTAAALNAVVDQILTPGGRSNAVKTAILITDGQSDDFLDTRHAADRLQAQHIALFSLGIGSTIDQSELEYVATEPSCRHVFTVPTFDDITSIIEEIQRSACRAPYYANSTVVCQLGKCPPYAFPMPKEGLTILANVTCGEASVYAALHNPYPSQVYYEVSMSVRPGETKSFYKAASGAASPYLYVTARDAMNNLQGSTCYISMTPHIGEVQQETHVYCKQFQTVRNCTLDELSKFKDDLCKDTWKYPYNNPCTPDNVKAGNLKFADPFDNSKYLLCDLSGQLYIVQCPPGEVFDPQCLLCYGRGEALPFSCSNGGTITTSDMCTAENILAHNFFFPVDTDPTKFIHCDVWGKAWLQSCPVDEIWVQSKLTCEYASHVGANPCIHMTDPGHHRFYRYPADCTMYIMCNDPQDPLLMSCPIMQGWDDEIKTCRPKNQLDYHCP